MNLDLRGSRGRTPRHSTMGSLPQRTVKEERPGQGVVEGEEERMGKRISGRGGASEDAGVFGIRPLRWPS